MTEPTDEHRSKSRALADKGFEYLREGDYENALDVAKELEELRFTAAFDIGAQAHAALGNLKKAIETLERGVAKAPACWLNWQLLGNYRSDAGDHEKAAEAYQHALACPQVWADSVRLNQAILAERRGDHLAALTHLELVRDPKLSLEAAAARIDALRGAGRDGEALSLADECLGKQWGAERSAGPLGHIAAARGRMRLEMGVSSDEVRRAAMDAVEAFGGHRDLLALVRRIDARYSAQSVYFRLLVHGRLSTEEATRAGVKGYFITYDVVAETADEALSYAAAFESRDAPQAVLSLERSEAIETRPEDPMGVYWRTGRCYYKDEKDQ